MHPLCQIFILLCKIFLYKKYETYFVPNLTCNSHLEPRGPNLTTTIKGSINMPISYLLQAEIFRKIVYHGLGIMLVSLSCQHCQTLPSTMLPLLRENANNPTTVFHSLHHSLKMTNFLNAGQTPILKVDQPMYALCKKKLQ